jgi:hypothetical protein
LRQKAYQAFANVENFKLDDCEIESLENDLLNAALDQELQASWQFIQGLVESQKNQIDLATRTLSAKFDILAAKSPLRKTRNCLPENCSSLQPQS